MGVGGGGVGQLIIVQLRGPTIPSSTNMKYPPQSSSSLQYQGWSIRFRCAAMVHTGLFPCTSHWAEPWELALSWRAGPTEYIFYCKRAILFLSSSKILTPQPPSPFPPGKCVFSPQQRRGTHSPGGEEDGGSIFWKTREIGLPSYSKICTLWLALYTTVQRSPLVLPGR